jgi:hypothetical protein
MLLRKSLTLLVLIITGLVCVYAADITGKWTAEFDSQVGLQKYVFEFKVAGTSLTGVAISNIAGVEAKTALKDGKVNGDEVTFVEPLSYQGMDLAISYKGKISGDQISFSRDVAGQGGEQFVAKKAK